MSTQPADRPAAIGRAGLSVPEQVIRSAREAGDDLDRESLTAMMMLYRAVAAVDRTHAAELAPYKLSLGQFQALSVLHRVQEPVTMGELAELLSVRRANLTGLIDTLARRSLVQRVLNPRDRRSFLVEITPAAERLLEEFLPHHWRYLSTLTSGLASGELRQLAQLLDRLRNSVESAPPCPSSTATNGQRDARDGIRTPTGPSALR
ncbi:MarR family winged helix-turn-helix transcriptional regulator [Candidatus Mycolicibacterium alkanivorans]|uniref:MarR family transcriptional regulator n=1 Tax=Candidatus Mycolicibacterium alkanivorans TaxID=2954114 RepID=A0ABS9YYR8_9MYCO|nr:MarR family transcriptional regulator [Candidatus Mycolicibacterium alkanivorans]MCI4675873.1 MarR family transcriptional regulator [Candidatus Mycolicibacterium alkanivorans]